MAKKPKIKSEFTPKQQKFIDFYEGNATEAARKAGYKKPRASGHENLTKPNILAAIKNREKERILEGILSREERQIFWSRVIKGEETEQVVVGKGDERCVEDIKPKLSDRLKASELLGRSEADFTENIKHGGVVGLKELLDDIDGDSTGPLCQKD